MMLSIFNNHDSETRVRVVLIFGMGFVGKSIFESLQNENSISSYNEIPVDWRDATVRAAELKRINQLISKIDSDSGISRLDIVWAAGKSGFASSYTECLAEMSGYCDVIAFAVDLKRILGDLPSCYFHQISSAGSVYGSQKFIDSTTWPCPDSHYGKLKLDQENELSDSLSGLYRCLIYRLSSVYGFSRASNRHGLISTLIYAALHSEVIDLFGGADTLRDFVYSQDVSRFISYSITSESPVTGNYLLVSGKPASLREIVSTVESVVGKSIYIKFRSCGSNANDVSFSKNCMPAYWSPTDLRTGIGATYIKTRSYFSAGGKLYQPS
jgi:nucleoside-diphosphate-sugar epimerase